MAYEAYTAEQEAAKAAERELKKTQKLLKDERDEQACVRRAGEKDEREKKRIQERKETDERKADRERKKPERGHGMSAGARRPTSCLLQIR